MKNAKGLTFIELTIALGILAITLSVAVPTYQRWLGRTHERVAIEKLSDTITLAKSMVIAEGREVYICAGITGDCDKWEKGYRVVNKTGEVSKVVSLPRDVRLSFRGFPDSSTIIFGPDGATSNGTFIINEKTQLILNRRGRVRLGSG